MTTKAKPIFVFVVALFIALAPLLAPWYCGLFLWENNFKTSRFDRFYIGEDVRNYKYLIPSKQLLSNSSAEAISLGIIRPIASIFCGEDSADLQPIVELQKVNFANTPISIDLTYYTRCRSFIEIDVEKNSVIGRQHSGIVIVGTKALINSVGVFISFFSDRIRLILTFVVMFVLFVNARNRIIGLPSIGEKEFSPNLVWWSLFLGISSGLVFAVIPLPVSGEVTLKLLYFTSAYCHLGPVINYILSNIGLGKFRNYILASIVFLMLFSADSGILYTQIGLVLTGGVLIWSILKKELFSFFGLYNLAYLLSLMKVGLPPSPLTAYLPHWHFAPVYIGVYLLYQVMKESKVNSITFKALKFLQVELKEKDKIFNYESALKDICNSLNCSRASLLKINHDNSCTIWTYDQSNLVKKFSGVNSTTFPAAFSNSITTRKSLLHILEESEFAERLRTKSLQPKLGFSCFSIVPIFSGARALGAIACTGYEIDHNDKRSVDAFDSAIQIFAGYFLRVMEANSNAEKLGANKELDFAVNGLNSIQSLESSDDIEMAISRFSSIFGLKGFLGLVNNDSDAVRINGTFGLTVNEVNLVSSLGLVKNNSNEIGPVPLAIKTGDPIYVNDVGLIRGLLTEGSQDFMTRTESEAIAVVPFDYSLSSDENARAFLYLISKTKNMFDEYTQAAVQTFVSALKLRFDHLSLKSQHGISELKLNASKLGISQFIPKHLVDDYLDGKSIVEEDFGFLMMVDLKGSTALARSIGEKAFHSEVAILKEKLVEIFKPHNWILQQFVWDGFEFTFSVEKGTDCKISLSRWGKLVQPVFLDWKKDLLCRLGEKREIINLSYRVCFTYGDTSRGIVVEGETRKWSFTGNAIAVVSKVEQAAKQLDGMVFCDKSLVPLCDDNLRHVHTTNQGLEIYSYDEVASLVKKAS